MRILVLLFFVGAALCSCDDKLMTHSDLNQSELAFIKKLYSINIDEQIILFDSQSGKWDEVSQAGNFLTTQRIGAYWVDDRYKARTSINFSYYINIDTLFFHDRHKSFTSASFIEVHSKNSKPFNVYISGDSTKVWRFFKEATNQWKNARNY